MVSINIDLPDDLRTDAVRAAQSSGVSLEEFVRSCVAARLNHESDAWLGDATVEGADEAHIEYMRKGLEKAEKEIADGLGVPLDLEAIRREGMARLEAKKKRAIGPSK